MTLRKLPKIEGIAQPKNFQWDAPSDVLARWSEMPLAAEANDPNVVSIYDVIGEDPWTGGGFTEKRMAAALRSIGSNDVTVKINSPGGDMFAGIAIYNLLREHPAKVTVEVMGIAASAASIIAMAGDEIAMGLGTFLMIHNAWGIVIGNRHDMRDAADMFDNFDSALADIYEARTGQKRKAIEDMMDAETFMGPSEAIKNGFADRVDEGLKSDSNAKNSAGETPVVRRLEAILAKSGMGRSERRSLIGELTGSPAVAASGHPAVAGEDDFDLAGVCQLIETIRS